MQEGQTMAGAGSFTIHCRKCRAVIELQKSSVGQITICSTCGAKGRVPPPKEVIKNPSPTVSTSVESIPSPPTSKGVLTLATFATLTASIVGVLLFWNFIYIPSLSLINRKASPSRYSEELAKTEREIDKRTIEKLRTIPPFKGVQLTCYNCEKSDIVKYVSYTYKGKVTNIGFCSQCTPPATLGTRATQPYTSQYKDYLAKRMAIENEGVREKSALNQASSGSVPLWLWSLILVIWAIVGFAFCFLALIFPPLLVREYLLPRNLKYHS